MKAVRWRCIVAFISARCLIIELHVLAANKNSKPRSQFVYIITIFVSVINDVILRKGSGVFNRIRLIRHRRSM